jgi:Tol biopolymer transport system component
MPRSHFFVRLLPALFVAGACSDPGPIGPRLPRSATLEQSCALGLSDADAIAALNALTAQVDVLEASGFISAGQANALRKHLDNIRKSIASGNYCPAQSQLNAFKEQVRSLVSEGALTEDEAGPLIGGASDVLEGADYVTFSSDRNGNNDIYSVRPDGTNLVNHTTNAAFEIEGRWSPDGSKLAFQSDRDGESSIYVVNADGSGLTLLTEGGVTRENSLAWSPDGTRIVFMRSLTVKPELWVMNADGSGKVRIIDGESPAWSPDGTRLVYAALRDGNHDVFAIDIDGTDEIQLSNDAGFDGYPQWSPTGEQIVWRTMRHGNTEIYSIKPDGSEATRLTTTGDVLNHPSSFSPDGKLLATSRCASAGGVSSCQLFVLRADGSGETNVTNDASAVELNPKFSRDGKRLAFVRRLSPELGADHDVYVMNADGTGRRKLTDSQSDNVDPTWRPR